MYPLFENSTTRIAISTYLGRSGLAVECTQVWTIEWLAHISNMINLALFKHTISKWNYQLQSTVTTVTVGKHKLVHLLRNNTPDQSVEKIALRQNMYSSVAKKSCSIFFNVTVSYLFSFVNTMIFSDIHIIQP